MKTASTDRDQIQQSQPTPKKKVDSKGVSIKPPAYQIAAADQPRSLGNGNLSGYLQSKMEKTFDTDFSAVKINPNSKKATQLNAKAFAQGNQVHFAPGQYRPYSQSGQQVLKHELGHVVQQKKQKLSPTRFIQGMPVNDHPKLESEADRMANTTKMLKTESLEGGTSNLTSQPIQRLIMVDEVDDFREDAGLFKYDHEVIRGIESIQKRDSQQKVDTPEGNKPLTHTENYYVAHGTAGTLFHDLSPEEFAENLNKPARDLQSGDKITLVSCHAGKDSQLGENSFAEKLSENITTPGVDIIAAKGFVNATDKGIVALEKYPESLQEVKKKSDTDFEDEEKKYVSTINDQFGSLVETALTENKDLIPLLHRKIIALNMPKMGNKSVFGAKPMKFLSTKIQGENTEKTIKAFLIFFQKNIIKQKPVSVKSYREKLRSLIEPLGKTEKFDSPLNEAHVIMNAKFKAIWKEYETNYLEKLEDNPTLWETWKSGERQEDDVEFLPYQPPISPRQNQEILTDEEDDDVQFINPLPRRNSMEFEQQANAMVDHLFDDENLIY